MILKNAEKHCKCCKLCLGIRSLHVLKKFNKDGNNTKSLLFFSRVLIFFFVEWIFSGLY